jgi:hypothetical protein
VGSRSRGGKNQNLVGKNQLVSREMLPENEKTYWKGGGRGKEAREWHEGGGFAASKAKKLEN